MQKCKNGQNVKIETVKTQKCENGQYAKMVSTL